ncbi:MAG: hypothetical protein ACP5IJ_02170 [Candidatus Nanoarchaeia archaeon]
MVQNAGNPDADLLAELHKETYFKIQELREALKKSSSLEEIKDIKIELKKCLEEILNVSNKVYVLNLGAGNSIVNFLDKYPDGTLKDEVSNFYKEIEEKEKIYQPSKQSNRTNYIAP